MFARNIDNKGSIIRGVIALALFVASAVSFETSRVLSVTLALVGLFVAFEAFRGWCGLRACGIKTKF